MSKLPTKPLGRQRKRFAVFLIIIGLSTFLGPMITLNPPLLNRAQWSPFQIAASLYAGELPVPKGHFDEGLIEIALIYALMLVALAAVFWPKSPRPLTIISTIGMALSALAKFWRHGFLNVFGWDYWAPGRLRLALTGWVLPWIMPALLALCFAETLDVEDELPGKE